MWLEFDDGIVNLENVTLLQKYDDYCDDNETKERVRVRLSDGTYFFFNDKKFVSKEERDEFYDLIKNKILNSEE